MRYHLIPCIATQRRLGAAHTGLRAWGKRPKKSGRSLGFSTKVPNPNLTQGKEHKIAYHVLEKF